MRILLFAQLKDVAGCSEVVWRDAESQTCDQIWERLVREYPGLATHRSSVRLARNGCYVGDDEVFEADDEVALIPPVSGG